MILFNGKLSEAAHLMCNGVFVLLLYGLRDHEDWRAFKQVKLQVPT